MIIADTSGLLALFNRREPSHEVVRSAINATRDAVVISPYVIAELDYLAATRLGFDAQLTILRELASGAYELATIEADELARATEIVERYRDQNIGITDASLVVLAHKYRTRSLLTLDRRHLGVVRPLDGGRFKLIP